MDKISEDWYIDRSMKIILRRGSIFQRLLYWFYQIKLEELYDLIQIYLNKPDNMELLNIFERDTFVKPREYPRAYRILNGWQIKEASLKFIKN